MDILNALNESQRRAAEATEGYIRVIAGAGTGKTRALTHRYAYLVKELGISPSNILCITFTNKAASEMKRRIKAMLGASFDTSFVATLHAFCTRVLREDIDKLFYPDSFIVLDNTDQKKILEEVYDEMGIRMDTASFKFMIDQIRYYKNLLTYMDYLSDPSFDYDTLRSDKPSDEIIFRYIKKQRKYFGLDFFDLINFTIYLFRKHPDIHEKWQRRLCYIMVDEFQDITAKEFKMIRRLSEINRNLFVVGDPDQNIYEWRGANMSVIMDFEGWLNNPCFENQLSLTARDVVLAENYRSSGAILKAANSLIAKNRNRIEKSLVTDGEQGVPVHWHHGKNEADELHFICETVKAHRESGGRFGDIAVLYRSNFASRAVEQGFMSAGIPYKIWGGVGFYERTEIKDVLSYLRLVDNPDDDLSFKRVANLPRRKLGKTKMKLISDYAEEKGISLFTAAKELCRENTLKGSGAAGFIAIIENLREAASTLPVSELAARLLSETGYELYIRESGDLERLDNVAELMRTITAQEEEFGELLTLTVFLQTLALMRDSDSADEDDRVKLMTIHTAKGLEFEKVFIVGMTEGIFPSARSLEERKEVALEEERRLCFVALTRAKQALWLTECEGFGVKGFSKVPSRFLFDIGEENLERSGRLSDGIREECARQVRLFDKIEEQICAVGDQMRHKIFGEGIIEAVDEKNRTYYIRFVNGTRPISFDYDGLSHVF